jgi:anti-sigma28 factor (negative regulator of flagellin synthesis)
MDPFDNPLSSDQSAADPAEPTASSEAPVLPVIDDNATDEVRLEKIASLTKAVADGTYKVSDEEVARKIIESMLEPKADLGR